MKRTLAAALALALALTLAACGPKAPSGNPPASSGAASSRPAASLPEEVPAEPFQFTRDELPKLDGSTSTAPLAQAMCAVLLGEDLNQVADLINFSRTTQSYRNLMEGSADLLLAAEPAPEVLSELEAGGHWLLTPFAMDALVFVVNQDNPVDGLTVEQVQKIYTGEITNWSEVGGEDLAIVPFQRNAEAGSQTMFEKLVMAGLPLMAPPTSWTADSMSGLLEAVRSYDNSPSAIGYTVHYYANDMEMAKGLKVLAIDGVKPSADAIRAGEYPFLNPYFVAIDKRWGEEDPARILYDWVLGPDGQKLAELEGYVPVNTTQSEGRYRVNTDWSVLEEGAAATPDLDGGRWYPDYTDHLIPAPDYGPLLPYTGALAQNVHRWTDDQGVEHTQPGWTTPMYGLMTREGKLVTDAVYQSAETVTFRKDSKNILLPVLALGQAREEWGEANNGLRYAMAAQDGSWVTGFEFWGYAAREDELMLYGPAGLTWMDAATGYRADWSWEYLGVDTENLNRLITELQWLYGFNWLDEGIYLGHVNAEDSTIRIFQPESAEVVEATTADWEAAMDCYYAGNFGWEHWQLAQSGRTLTLIRGEEQYTLTLPVETDSVGYDVKEGLAAITDYNSVGTIGTSAQSWLFDLATGEVLLEGREIHLAAPREDFDSLAAVVVRQEDGTTAVYGPDLTQLDTLTNLTDRWVYVNAQEDWLAIQDGQTFYGCYDLTQGKYIFYRNLTLGE